MVKKLMAVTKDQSLVANYINYGDCGMAIVIADAQIMVIYDQLTEECASPLVGKTSPKIQAELWMGNPTCGCFKQALAH